VLKVGLTGGIGAGKSAAVSRLAALGAVVVDSDRLAREVVEPGTDGLAEVVAAFGPQVLDAAGALDRPALGRVVFGDADARRRLEAILHPRIRARSAALNAAAPADAIVVNDVPLLVESGIAPAYHLVIVVDAAPQTRVERLVRDRGMTRDEATARIAAQIDDATRRAAADVVLDNGGDRAALDAAVDALWADRLVPFERNVREKVVAPRPAIVHLVEPDPTWPAQFARLAARLRHHLGDRRIDHVGSTSVPGLPAKDIIDMQLTVESVAEADGLDETLTAAGFPVLSAYRNDKPKADDPGPWEKRLHGTADPGRPVHLHLRVEGSPGWRWALLFRDLLRADPELRADYLALKRGLAGRPRDLYTAGKEPWFDAAHDDMERWAASTGWTP
jgi:dephospho-CoA kinase